MAGLPAIVGLLLTLLFVGMWAIGTSDRLGKWLADLDPAERIGVSGLIALGFVGTLTLLIGLLPNGPEVAVGALFLIGLGMAGASRAYKNFRFAKPSGLAAVAVGLFAVAALVALIGALSPANTMEWDSLAYHLAVPKLWLQRGQIGFVEGIHHSNFPFVVDNLYLLGLQWGETGAKAFSWCFLTLGGFWIFGFVRRRMSADAAAWALILYAGIPVVLWEAGTAYIDLAHGLFAAIAVAYASEMLEGADRRVLVGLGAGFCIGSKFTGLVVAGSLAMAWLLIAPRTMGFGTAAKKFGLAAVLALALAAPWFVKTAVLTGNPVYPFFYSKFGGRDWSEWQSEIFTNEQQSFGVPRSKPTNFGHSVIGLAYQPGRYVNPDQTNGGGFPIGALGFAVLLCALSAAVSGKLKASERFVLVYAGIGLVLWFFALSQQSRYMTMIALPLILPAVALAAQAGWKRLLAGAAVLQIAYSIGMIYATQTRDQMRVALGVEERSAYQERTIGFKRAADFINQTVPKDGKVALYDELFGYMLDVPYMWANPGHSSLIPYSEMTTGEAFASKLKELGFTHVYINASRSMVGEDVGPWLAEMGLREGEGFTDERRAAIAANREVSWRLGLLAAVKEGHLRPIQPPASIGSGVVFEIEN
jgi:hypothetical protein